MPVECNLRDRLAERLKQARAALGLTQKEWSAQSGMPLPSLKNYEGSKQIPGGEALCLYARAGINTHWLLTGEGPILLRDVGAERAADLVTRFEDYWHAFEGEQSRNHALVNFVARYNDGTIDHVEGLDAISVQQVNAAYDVSIRSHTDAGDEETLVVVKEVPQPLNVGALKAMLRAAIEMVQAGATTPDRAADLAAKLYVTALESGEITPTGVGPGNHGKAA